MDKEQPVLSDGTSAEDGNIIAAVDTVEKLRQCEAGAVVHDHSRSAFLRDIVDERHYRMLEIGVLREGLCNKDAPACRHVTGALDLEKICGDVFWAYAFYALLCAS